MLTQRDVCACAWHMILSHGAMRAEDATDARIEELRADGCSAGVQMWQDIKARIPELLADPDVWDDLPD